MIGIRTAAWLALFLLASLGDSRTALGHRPRLPVGNDSHATAYAIGDSEISWAIYASLSADIKVAYYTFEVKEQTVLEPQLLVEDERHSDGFDPLFILYGSAVSGEANSSAFPIAIPAGMHVRFAAAMNEHYFESFTRKSYRRTALMRTRLEPGTYGIAVFEPASHAGDYVLPLGTAEQFDGTDFPPMFTGCGRIFY